MDNVQHPKHYNSHPSGIECITITKWYNYCVGNAIKYLWRQGLKNEEGMTSFEKQIEDLRKAQQFIQFEIDRLTELENQTKVNIENAKQRVQG